MKPTAIPVTPSILPVCEYVAEVAGIVYGNLEAQPRVRLPVCCKSELLVARYDLEVGVPSHQARAARPMT